MPMVTRSGNATVRAAATRARTHPANFALDNSRHLRQSLADLGSIADWLTVNYQATAPLVGRPVQSMIAHIARWLESACSVPNNRRYASSRR
jgi:hypothetical protein